MASMTSGSIVNSEANSNCMSDETDKEKKSINFFLDVNPETNCLTVFDRGLIGGGCRDAKIILNKQTPQDVIDKELANNMLMTEKGSVIARESLKLKGDFIKVVQNSNPKGVMQICEMCPTPAVLRCRKCMTTYYCGWGHQTMDTAHPLLCPKLKIIGWPTLHGLDCTTRNRLVVQKLVIKERLLEDLVHQGYTNLYSVLELYSRQFQEFTISRKSILNQTLAHKGNITLLLTSRKLPLALGLFHQSLKYMRAVYGHDNETLQLITVHTALTEVQLCMRKIGEAEQSMNVACTLLLRTEEKEEKHIPSTCAHAQVNKTQGLLAYAKGNMQDAVYHFSECIYYMSEAFSPTNVRVCVGYYNLGKSFYAMSKKADGLYSLSFSLKLWLMFLGDELTAMTTQKKIMRESSRENGLLSQYLEMEATDQLSGLQTYFNEESHPIEIFRINLCQGIIHFGNKKFAETLKCINRYDSKFKDEGNVMAIFKLVKKHAGRRALHGSPTPVTF